MLNESMISLIRCRRTDFYWWASIHRLMKDSKVLAKVRFVIRRMEGTIFDGASPRAIVVVNAFASHLIRTGRALGALNYEEALGADMYMISEKRVPVFL